VRRFNWVFSATRSTLFTRVHRWAFIATHGRSSHVREKLVEESKHGTGYAPINEHV
jgi:hypothetical protein